MSSQPPRFAARSIVIRDHIISRDARLLYLLLDDIGWKGECAVKQPVLADFLCADVRTIQRWAAHLQQAGYIEIDRQKHNSRYVLGWAADTTPMSHLESPQLRQNAGSVTTPVPDLSLLSKTEFKAEGNASLSNCQNCKGRGLVPRIIRGYEVTEFCRCPAGEQRRVA